MGSVYAGSCLLFSWLITFGPDFRSTSTSTYSLCFALGRGPIPVAKKVERRTDVHVGVRDSIVHVDIKRPRFTAIVRITTAQNEPETRTPGHRDDSLERKYTLKRIWKKVKELKKKSDRFAVWVTYRSRFLLVPSGPFRPLPHTPDPMATPLLLRREAHRCTRRSPRQHSSRRHQKAPMNRHCPHHNRAKRAGNQMLRRMCSKNNHSGRLIHLPRFGLGTIPDCHS